MRKVLIANRGEIAVRVIRACRDAGLASVAVYADSDRDALHATPRRRGVRAGRRHRRRHATCASTSCIDVAAQAGADAVHPGYGFLSENADFAQAVIDAGLTWIGPTPQAIRDLGDKVTARHIAQRAGAPLVPGTADPVAGADEVIAFAVEHGLPVAIKAAFGGGGRGLKVARTHGGDPAPVRVGHPGGGRRVRPGRVLRRALPGPAPARRGAGPGRPARQRDRGRHPGLLAAAPAPEAGRGGARAVPHRRAARARSTTAPRRSAARPATTAPARSNTWSARTAPSPSWRSTPGCRSSTRSPRRPPASTWSASSSGSPTARSCGSPRTRRRAGTPSSSGSTARTRAAASCPPPARSPRCACPPAPAYGSTPASSAGASSAATSTRCWPR